MEKLSEIAGKRRIPVEIKIHPYMRDHRFAGKNVVPAVESCAILAQHIGMPEYNTRDIYNASFDKFIEIKPADDTIQAFVDIEPCGDDNIAAKLITKTKAGKSGITRTNVHVVMQFRKKKEAFREPVSELTFDTASASDGVCIQLSQERIYSELVLFGPAYHNIKKAYLTKTGVIAEINAPQEQGNDSLGSPFVFDAALHAANIWGQRYRNIVAYPVGFGRRIIISPAKKGERYFVKVIPVPGDSNELVFDIWIYDTEGNLCEAGFGIRIKDVNSGATMPPEWISKINNEPLKYISLNCEAFSIVELESLLPFAHRALSPEELRRLEPMREKRRMSFISARLACKFLSRKLAGNDSITPADHITTVMNDIYPVCPLPETDPYTCSVSHDSRFAIAAASRKKIGVDVEEISDRVLKTGRMYMNDEEKKLSLSSGLDEIEASLRIWSIKEAVTKALNIDLTDSWKRVNVNNIGINKSTFQIDGREISAYHDTVDIHVFTLVLMD